MTLDSTDFLPSVIPLMGRRIGILYALGINDAETRPCVAPLFDTSRATLIFLKHVQERLAGYLL